MYGVCRLLFESTHFLLLMCTFSRSLQTNWSVRTASQCLINRRSARELSDCTLMSGKTFTDHSAWWWTKLKNPLEEHNLIFLAISHELFLKLSTVKRKNCRNSSWIYSCPVSQFWKVQHCPLCQCVKLQASKAEKWDERKRGRQRHEVAGERTRGTAKDQKSRRLLLCWAQNIQTDREIFCPVVRIQTSCVFSNS